MGDLAHTALADAWEVLARAHGGATAEVRGMRLATSGVPRPWWNPADVTAPDADLAAAHRFFAEHAVPWGLRVPATLPWSSGRPVTRLRVMRVDAPALRPAPAVPGLAVRTAGPADLEDVLRLDAVAFDGAVEESRPWMAPFLGAPGIEVALGVLDGTPVVTAYSVRSDGRAGPAVHLGGVAVAPAARRRGAGARVSSWLLERAVAAGAVLAHLRADTPAAARVYVRLGFADAEPLDVYAPDAFDAAGPPDAADA